MTPLSRFTALLGTKTARGLLSCIAVILIYGWMSGQLQVPWLVPLVALLLAGRTFSARRQLLAFQVWQARWNEMQGISDSARTARRKRPWAITTWGCLVFILVAKPYPDPVFTGTVQLAFMVASAWLICAFIWKWMRRLRTRERRTQTKAVHIVRTLLPVPRVSPSVQDAIKALPDYCQALLTLSRELAARK